MARPVTWYSEDLGDRDPVPAMREASERLLEVTSGWSAERWNLSYATGKWSARLIVTHLAHTEMALGTRVRMALAVPGYIAQNFDQDAWLTREAVAEARESVNAFVALSRMNCTLFESLSAEDLATGLTHPEQGALTVDWVIHQLAGHQRHHLPQLEQIARVPEARAPGSSVADIVRRLVEDEGYRAALTAQISSRTEAPEVIEALVSYARGRQATTGHALTRKVLTAAGVSWEAV